MAGYPSHEFVVDKAEAETLFSAVRSPTALGAALATFLLKEVWDNLSDPEGRRRARVRCLTRVPERPVEKEADDDAVRVTGRVAPPAAGRKGGRREGGRMEGGRCMHVMCDVVCDVMCSERGR